jgi:hypothetical protein
MSTKVFGKSSLFIGRSKKLGQLSLEECGRFFGAKIFLPFRGKKEEKKKKRKILAQVVVKPTRKGPFAIKRFAF